MDYIDSQVLAHSETNLSSPKFIKKYGYYLQVNYEF